MWIYYNKNGEIFEYTPKNSTIRKSHRYKKWRNLILQRDNFTCQNCNNEWWLLEVHHIENFIDNPENFNINNWITLCKKCHILEHKKIKYGK